MATLFIIREEIQLTLDHADINLSAVPCIEHRYVLLNTRRGEATFRILEKALRALRNSHLDPLSPYFNNIMNNNKRPESLITCM